ncbi:MAG: MSCRAMM family adhesin SdrC [Actinobacteria bacterium]|nr:MSCRAMM family adhesin SdrC [Actinomycetota bacterium]
MADGDDDNKPLDLDSMSDEEFMKLDPSQLQAVFPEEEEDPNDDSQVSGSENDEDSDTGSEEDGGDDTPSGSDSDAKDDGDSDQEEDVQKDPDASSDTGNEGDPEPKPEGSGEKEGSKSDTPKGEDDKSKKPDDGKKPEAKDEKPGTGDDDVKSAKAEKADPKAATDFFEKVTAPFKADGKDMQVKTPEDAIRLMQMGVNYSRRMQEMKPLRAQDQMLRENNLNSPDKLNFLIDLSKGKKEAIKKLLQDHKIDPVDIDVSSEDTPYKATNYQGDPKDLAFDDAIKETLNQDGGRQLISDINKDWDTVSKEALRDQPSIFQNIFNRCSLPPSLPSGR